MLEMDIMYFICCLFRLCSINPSAEIMSLSMLSDKHKYAKLLDNVFSTNMMKYHVVWMI